MEQKRNTTQFLMPYHLSDHVSDGYDIYPSHKLGSDKIYTDFKSLARRISSDNISIIDGYVGVDFAFIRERLESELRQMDLTINWVNTEDLFRSESEIDQLIGSFMGERESIFGSRATIELSDYFDQSKLNDIKISSAADINIIYGAGAQLVGLKGTLVYIDLPKNELQFRARANFARNLGTDQVFDMRTTYKRFYFVDWVVLNRHKKQILKQIDVIVDGQGEEHITWMEGDDLRTALNEMGKSLFRVRPWFEPGVWGGSWMKENIKGVNPDVPNYAWSFELITPENGIVFESNNNLLEVSFDFLMYQEGDAVMGKHREVYGDEFPIRFDFLDTFDGGNLSIQCHPYLEYAKEHFGEQITQEETYYILDRKEGASVYLGFQENIQPEEFRTALWDSFNTNKELDITRYVQKHSAQKHDLFLIPPGTIHGSGINNLVLEISTTPYIFTFKMYDWVRPDLNGKPRPLNIEHGIKNLDFGRKGEKVRNELISQPQLLAEGNDWKHYELPTHEEHSYRVNRYHFKRDITIQTEGKFNVLNLVEGSTIEVETENGSKQIFKFAETFVVPAAAMSYKIKNNSVKEAIVVVAFMK
jgi:mannose-6-phosphate isomerase class I